MEQELDYKIQEISGRIRELRELENKTPEEMAALELKEFLDTLTNIEKVEVLPYHSMGEPKWEKLGIPYTLTGTKPPDAERLENARRILGAE